MSLSRKPSFRERQSLKTGRLTHGSMCAGKHKFTQAKALRQAERTSDKRITAYPCLFCDHWHIGHTPSR